MKTPRLVLIAVLAFAVVGVGIADGRPHKGKATFSPKVGDYAGTATASGKSQAATAKVTKAGGKVGLLIMLPATLTCSDGTSRPDSLNFSVEVKKNSFSYSATGSGHNTYKLNGKFTSATALSGTASKEGPLSDMVADSPNCSSGKVSFSLKKKK